MLAVDSTARPFECDIGEKPNILAGYRDFNRTGIRRAPRPAGWGVRRIGHATCDRTRSHGGRAQPSALPILFERQRRL